MVVACLTATCSIILLDSFLAWGLYSRLTSPTTPQNSFDSSQETTLRKPSVLSKMSATNSARCVANFGGRNLRNLRNFRQVGSIPKPAHNRVALSTYCLTLSPPSRTCSQTSRQVYSRFKPQFKRAFSATSTSSHGHWEPPKPGEEYVRVPFA